ncbi:hypothetical protein DSLASN_10940 [Desulfoluna limicola]|uniref:Uncharacterized protein n=1 Tax=Desulfoluna limicola TaxID=2810562 RepID=A0ABM7PDX6_9BACT|nr:hypothetical protein [Desulfoluna limicola]BCS95462.1 hypothetical protein DSLASN_10940 [Desulfoluna limicola]
MKIETGIALTALLISGWSFYRLCLFQNRNEYKDTRYIFKECLSEAKDLIEKITIDMESLIRRRVDFDLLDSDYIGSYGYQQAYQAFMVHYRSMNEQKSKTIQIYQDLSETLKATDRSAFDKLILLQKEIKDIYIEFIESFAKAKTEIDGIENMANYQKKKA